MRWKGELADSAPDVEEDARCVFRQYKGPGQISRRIFKAIALFHQGQWLLQAGRRRTVVVRRKVCRAIAREGTLCRTDLASMVNNSKALRSRG